MKIIVSQKGAREHYAVVQALHQRWILAGLVTDWYAFGQSAKKTTGQQKTRPQVRSLWYVICDLVVHCLSSVVRNPSAKAARCEAIPDELVHAFPLRSLLWKWRLRRLNAQGRLYEAFAQTDAAFARAVGRCQLPPHDVFFGYSYASLETLAAEKQRGILTVLDQIDPGAVEFRLVADEMEQHPELAGPPLEFPTANFERNRREWELADIIIVNSEWSRDAIVVEGADPGKIEILPLAYETSSTLDACPSALASCPSTSPLRILWLGQVNVRKGIHYLMAAAQLLERENIRFDVVGPIGILAKAVASAPPNMAFHGSVSRDRAAEWYRQSDVFVLPTLSDGFALTQLEALAHGLPVIATPNCGRVVEDGKTGFIIPPRDPQALANAILKFARNPALAGSMRPQCLESVKAYSVEAYGQRLLEIIQNRL